MKTTTPTGSNLLSELVTNALESISDAKTSVAWWQRMYDQHAYSPGLTCGLENAKARLAGRLVRYLDDAKDIAIDLIRREMITQEEATKILAPLVALNRA